MKVHGKLIALIKKVVLDTNDQGGFVQFTSDNDAELPLDFENETEGNFVERVFQYLNKLNKDGLIFTFLDLYLAAKGNAVRAYPSVVAMLKERDRFFEKSRNGQTWVRSKAPFHCSLVKNKLPFVNRSLLKDRWYELVGRNNGFMIVKGEPQSGLSYIAFYGSHIAEVTPFYKFLDMDLNDIDANTPEQLDDVDIANYIVMKLKMRKDDELYQKGTFKAVSFVTTLNEFLDARPYDDTVLFFFHQFKLTFSENAIKLIHSLVKKTCLENMKCYIVLSGYPYGDKLDYNLSKLAELVSIDSGSFTKTHLDDFFEAMYLHLTQNFSVGFTKQQYLETTENLVSKQLLVKGATSPNVAEIGRILTDWIDTF